MSFYLKGSAPGPILYLQIMFLSICPRSNLAFVHKQIQPPKHVLFSFYVYLRNPPKTKQKTPLFQRKIIPIHKIPQQKNLPSSTSPKNYPNKKNPSNNFHSFATQASYEFDTFRAPLVVPTPSSSSSSHRGVPALPASPAAARDAALAVLEGLLPRHWELHGGGALKAVSESDHLMVGCTYWVYITVYHGPPKPTFLEVFMVSNLVFRWPNTFIFHGFGGSWYIYPRSPRKDH